MSLDFGNSPSNNLSRAASLVSNTDPRPISVSIWFKADSATAEVRHSLFSNTFSSNPRLYLPIDQVSGATYKPRLFSGAYVDGTNFTLTTNWMHFGWTWDTDDSVAFFLNGVANGTSSKTIGGTTSTGCRIGALDGSTAAFDMGGEAAEFAAWNTILDAGEWASLGAAYSPALVRPSSLVVYPKMLRSKIQDEVDGLWTVNGTLTVATHPRIIYPTRPQFVTPPAVVGGGLSIPVAMHHYTKNIGAA